MEATFRAHGCARAGFAIFLLVWLAAWSAGELFVARALLWSLEGGWNSVAARSLFHPMGWLVGAFVLLWFTAWTMGGVAAIFELLRMLSGNDHLRITPDGWTIRRGVGPFGRTKHIPQSEFRDVYLRRSMGALVVETAKKDIEVTSFGTVQERRAVVERFRRDAALDELPRDWQASEGTGATVIARRAIDSPGCLALVGGVAVLSFVFAVAFQDLLARWGIILAVSVGVLLAALFVWGLSSRREWHVRRGAVSVVVRWLAWKRETEVDRESLEIEVSSDSDGDEWVTLRGTALGKKIVLLREMNDARTILRLARRIASVTGWTITVPHVLKREAREF